MASLSAICVLGVFSVSSSRIGEPVDFLVSVRCVSSFISILIGLDSWEIFFLSVCFVCLLL